MQFEIPHEAVVKYMERRKTDIDNCRLALKNGDLTLLETVGHQLKGNGVTFGFPEISTIGEALEAAAKQHNADAAAIQVDALASVVANSPILH
jgi:HPt (histidine-containing phosphotransfer) domain-containing protein